MVVIVVVVVVVVVMGGDVWLVQVSIAVANFMSHMLLRDN